MRIIVRFKKGREAKFLSHLDLQRVLQRAMRRAKVPLAYSQGFNPHPLLSFATALSVGQTSEAEWFDVMLEQDMDPQEFLRQVNDCLPEGISFLEAKAAPENYKSITSLMSGALYEVTFSQVLEIGLEELNASVIEWLQGPVMVMKKTKSGIKPVDLTPLVRSAKAVASHPLTLELDGVLDASNGLNAAIFGNAFAERFQCGEVCSVHRKLIYSENDCVLPKKSN